MPFTKSSDVIIPEILVDAIQGEFVGATLLANSGVAVISNTLPANHRGGDTVKVPYFGTLGEMEDITNEGDALTPESLSQSFETATVIHAGKAFETTEWARLKAANDPYEEAARQFRILTERRVDRALIEKATAALPSGFVYTSNKNIDYDTIVDASGLWGDQQAAIRMLGVHSKVYRDLLKLKDSTGRNLLVLPTGPGDVPRFVGIPVFVSDKCNVIAGSPTTYESIIVKDAALAFWYQQEPIVLTDTDILAHSDVLAIHMYFAVHRYLRVRGSTYPGVIKVVTT